MNIHPIKQYCIKNGVQIKEFAKRLGISGGYLSTVLAGKSIPSLLLAYDVEVVTMGAINMQSLAKWHKENDLRKEENAAGDQDM